MFENLHSAFFEKLVCEWFGCRHFQVFTPPARHIKPTITDKIVFDF